MDFAHHIHTYWKRMASQVRVPKLSSRFAAFKNYARLGLYLASAISLGLLAFNETKRSSIDSWLQSNLIDTKYIVQWLKSFELIETEQSKLIREAIRSIPYDQNGAALFCAKNAPIVVLIDASGQQRTFAAKNFRPTATLKLEWVAFSTAWNQSGRLFEHLNQQILNFNKTLKVKAPIRYSDPYELRY